MCGIVGFTGTGDAAKRLINGLKYLEYRGYDSAGLSVIKNDAIVTVKAVGKVANLDAKAAQADLASSTGIAHTRWATHGAPLEKNAHPHLDCSGRFAVVHNGIIENYTTLREQLVSCQAKICSKTAADTADCRASSVPGCVLPVLDSPSSKTFDTPASAALNKSNQASDGQQSCSKLSVDRTLESKRHHFVSDTDSEVIPALIAEFYRGDFLEAVTQALRQLTGTYGIAVISPLHPDTVIAARHGSPIVIGLGKEANLVASDVTALAGYTRNVIYLNDGDVAILTPDKVDIVTLDKAPVHRDISVISFDAEATGKGGFEHYMLKEIHEQPEAVANTMRGRLNKQLGSAVLSGLNLTPRDLSQISRIVIAGCGSSMHAGLVGEYYFEDIAGIPTEVEQAAEFRYRNPIIESNTLVIPISQSGETADTLAAVREACNKGAIVAAISNVVGSTIARECGRGVYLHAGPEISVASTKGFTTQVTALLLMSLMLGRNRRLSNEEGKQLIAELEQLPDLIRQVIATAPKIEKIAEKYAQKKDFFFIGRGTLYPAALEGALKLKEISYVHAEGYHAAELKHGPIALLDENAPVVALANNIPGKDKMLGNIQECIARHAPVIAVVTAGADDEVSRLTSDILTVPASSRFIAPLTTVTALQLFAYYLAKARGCEIDQPRNLAKSVTVE